MVRNCRPVSLTSIIGYMFESIIKDEITIHFGKINIIKAGQWHYESRIILDRFVRNLEDVMGSVRRGEPVDVVYLDFYKGLDKVDIRSRCIN